MLRVILSDTSYPVFFLASWIDLISSLAYPSICNSGVIVASNMSIRSHKVIKSPARSPFSYLSSYSSSCSNMSDTFTVLSDSNSNCPDFARLFISANLAQSFLPSTFALGTHTFVILVLSDSSTISSLMLSSSNTIDSYCVLIDLFIRSCCSGCFTFIFNDHLSDKPNSTIVFTRSMSCNSFSFSNEVSVLVCVQ